METDIDGDFGTNTFNAVKDFQEKDTDFEYYSAYYNETSSLGFADPFTIDKLNEKYTGYIGSLTKEEITELQRKLIAIGYSCVVNGVYDMRTQNCIKYFKIYIGITPENMDGKLNTETLEAIDDEYKKLGGCENCENGCLGCMTVDEMPCHYSCQGECEDGCLGCMTVKEFGGNQQSSGINKFVDIAIGEIGEEEKVVDGEENHTTYGEWYGADGEPWCAIFVAWCANKAGILEELVPKYKYCPYGMKWYRDKNKLKYATSEYDPKSGDTIFFGQDGPNSHTGIVIAYDPNKRIVYIVEGNSSDAVRQCHYQIDKNKKLSDYNSAGGHGNTKKILCYGVNGGYSNGKIPSNSIGR